MESSDYDRSKTALLFVDPYNDFLSEGGLVWPRLKAMADEIRLLDNLRAIDKAVRDAGVQVVFVPHRRWQARDYELFQFKTAGHQAIMKHHHFALGMWGGEWHPDFQPRPEDIVAHEHWCSSGFANTDLDFKMKQRGITHVILVGLLANTCIEATGRHATELGYHVTLVTDATAALSPEMMHAAHALNGPTYAHRILSTRELCAELAEVALPEEA